MLKASFSDNYSDEREVRLDKITRALMCIDYVHHELHGGSLYSMASVDADLDTDDTLILAFKTPNDGKQLHVLVEASNTSSSLLEILEGSTITAGTGTDKNPINHNRNSSNVSTCISTKDATAGKITENPTISSDGTQLYVEFIGVGRERGSGSTDRQHEYILKENTVYAFRLTGKADNGTASLNVTWYEHTPKT